MSGWQCRVRWHVSVRNVFRNLVRSHRLRKTKRIEGKVFGHWKWWLWPSTVDRASIASWRWRLWGAGSAGELVLRSWGPPPFLRQLCPGVSVTAQSEREVKMKDTSDCLMPHTFGWSSFGTFGLFKAPRGLPLGLSVNPLPRYFGSLDEVSI